MTADGAPGSPTEAFYDHFPYPRMQRVVPSRVPAHTAGTLSHLCRRRRHEAFGVRPRIWVAGCGTQQGVTWALNFPEGEVLATDTSRVTLDRAEGLARALGVENVTFTRRDLRRPATEEPFDLVVCTGVVHHLEDPAEGLARIRDALAPRGAALVMVYSRAHRGPLELTRRAALRLAEGLDDPYEAALLALDGALAPRSGPVARELLESLHAVRETDRSFVADVLLNPLETSYDVPELMALVERAGLRFTEWLHPPAWRLATYTEDAALLARAADLGPLAEAALVHDLLGLASPLLQVLVERDDAPVRPAYTQEEKAAMPIVRSDGARVLDVEGGRLNAEHAVPPWTAEGDWLTGFSRAGQAHSWALPAEALPLLEACDGTRTARELAEAFRHWRAPSEIESLIDALGPAGIGLLAPAWACERSPAAQS